VIADWMAALVAFATLALGLLLGGMAANYRTQAKLAVLETKLEIFGGDIRDLRQEVRGRADKPPTSRV
jgi:hypothetical protein